MAAWLRNAGESSVAEQDFSLTDEQIADNELRIKFGLTPMYSEERNRNKGDKPLYGTMSMRRFGAKTSELQEYEKGILDIVKSQNALKSSMRARMAASGQSTEDIERKMAELTNIFSEEVKSMYSRGAEDIRNKFDPYGALKQRADYYEISSSGMAYGDMMEKAKGWKEWW